MASVQFKVVLLGEGCVGKTSLVVRYCQNKFSDKHESTIQASFLMKKMTINCTRVSLAIWDTAGQERFHALGPIYYRDANGAVLVYDVTDSDSLVKVKTWVKELRKMLGNNVALAIVGNKIDLLPSHQQNNNSNNELILEAQQYCQTANATHYTTSAKSNRGIDEMFLDLTKRMMQQAQQQQQAKSNLTPTSSRTLRIADPAFEENEEENRTNKCSC